MRRFDDEDLTGAEFRECDLSRTRMVGVVMQDAEIDGLVTNLVVNGVEVMAHVEAELDRRHPVRLLLRSDRPADLREAWQQLQADWAATTARVRSMPEDSEHQGVDGEWSMVETLRHLVFVHDSWFRRCVLGTTEPFTGMGLGPPLVMERESALDPTARPSLDEVLAVRSRQAAEVQSWLSDVRPDRLAQTAPVPDDDRWPPYAQGRTVRQCLGTVLDEEWAHHGFCARDLDKLAGRDASVGGVTGAVDEPRVPTLYEWAGGDDPLRRMIDCFYDRVEADDALSGFFPGGVSTQHRAHVTDWWAEVLGGPATYTEQHGGYEAMLRHHLVLAITPVQRHRFAATMSLAADDAVLPADPEFRAAIIGYLEWGTRLAMENSQPGARPVEQAPTPRWGWGVAPPYQG